MKMTPLEERLGGCNSSEEVFRVGTNAFFRRKLFDRDWKEIRRHFMYHELKEAGTNVGLEDIQDAYPSCGCVGEGKVGYSVGLVEGGQYKQKSGKGTPKEITLSCLNAWYGMHLPRCGYGLQQPFLSERQIKASPYFYRSFANSKKTKGRTLWRAPSGMVIGIKQKTETMWFRDIIYFRLCRLLKDGNNRTSPAERFRQYVEAHKKKGSYFDLDNPKTREAAVNFALARGTSSK